MTVRLAQMPSEHLMVNADATYLMVLIQNLLSNAHKYGASAAGIDVELATDASEASIVVLDRGVGLDDVDPEVLFHPFYRSPAAERMASGLGLGLPVCQRIVTALGGRIWARPRPGGGSEFGFALPLASESLLPD